MRRVRGITGNRQSFVASVPFGALEFDMPANQRIRLRTSTPGDVAVNSIVFDRTLGALTLSATGGPAVTGAATITLGVLTVEAELRRVGGPSIQPTLTVADAFVIGVTPEGVGSVAFDASNPCRIYWAFFAADTVSAVPSEAGPVIAAGTGALTHGFFDAGRGTSVFEIAFPPGIDVAQGTFAVIARDVAFDPASDWSNILKDTDVAVSTEAWGLTVADGSITVTQHPTPTTPEWIVNTSDGGLTVAQHPE